MGVSGQWHILARYSLYRRLDGSQDQSGRVWKISPLPGYEPQTVHPIWSPYTNWAVLADNLGWYVLYGVRICRFYIFMKSEFADFISLLSQNLQILYPYEVRICRFYIFMKSEFADFIFLWSQNLQILYLYEVRICRFYMKVVNIQKYDIFTLKILCKQTNLMP